MSVLLFVSLSVYICIRWIFLATALHLAVFFFLSVSMRVAFLSQFFFFPRLKKYDLYSVGICQSFIDHHSTFCVYAPKSPGNAAALQIDLKRGKAYKRLLKSENIDSFYTYSFRRNVGSCWHANTPTKVKKVTQSTSNSRSTAESSRHGCWGRPQTGTHLSKGTQVLHPITTFLECYKIVRKETSREIN